MFIFMVWHFLEPEMSRPPKTLKKNTKSYGKALFRVFLEYKPLCSQKWKIDFFTVF